MVQIEAVKHALMIVRPAAASSFGPFVGLLWSDHARRGRTGLYSRGILSWC